MTKHIFITGAAGFIGFHVAQHLHRRGDKVIGFDNFNDYYSVDLKKKRAHQLKNECGIEIIAGDICQKELLQQSMENHHTTHLLHLAAQAGVRHSLSRPQDYIKANIDGFLQILECCRNNNHIKLTYASSSSVYGVNKKVPFSLEDPTDKQASLYGATKKANELMAHTYHHLFGVAATGLRFFTVYGPWGRPDMAYYTFTKAIDEGLPIDVFNDGRLQRDFTYIDDIVQGTVAAIDLESSFDIFNLGNNKPVELQHFIACIEKQLGKKAKKNYLPMQPGDVIATYADITYTREKLRFSPQTSIEEGITKFVAWYLEHHNRK